MALQSPGVQVTVIDESFYTPAEPGTTPLIVVATAQDKTNGAGTSTASATTQANAGKAFKLTSQKDLVDLFGVPFFEKTASSSPMHAGERNEYGLLAAYSLLGVSNAAFVVRADINLDELAGKTDVPGALPTDGSWWVDTQTSTWGIQEWNGAKIETTGGQKFATKTPIVLTDADTAKTDSGAPLASVGSIGDYAVVFQDSISPLAKVWYKSSGNAAGGVDPGQWVHVGSTDWKASHATVIAGNFVGGVAGTLTLNGGSVSVLTGSSAADVVGLINGAFPGATGVTANIVNDTIRIYNDGTANNNVIEISGTNALLKALGFIPSTSTATSLTYNGPALQQTPHTQVPQWKRSTDDYNNGEATGSVWMKTTEPNGGARVRVKRWSSATESWVSNEAPIYATTTAALYYLDRSGGGKNLDVDVLFTQSNADEQESGEDATPPTSTFKMWKRHNKGATIVQSIVVPASQFTPSNTFSFDLAESLLGQTDLDVAKSVTVTTTSLPASRTASDNANALAGAINAAGFTNIEASVTVDNRVQITHKNGGDFKFTNGTVGMTTLFNDSTDVYGVAVGDSTYDHVATNWIPFIDATVNVSADAPLNEPVDGQLWYNPAFGEVDIMIHDGTTWVGYKNELPSTSATGPVVSASNPYEAGTTVNGDLWISTADLENYPTIYRYNTGLTGVPAANRWDLVDKTDQLSEEGILFADARWDLNGESTEAASIVDLLTSDFLDFDAPDPDLYPRGMLLWNLRRSGGNVKQYKNNYVDTATNNPRFNNNESMADYATDRWVTASANQEDGSGTFGRKAQRKVVIQAMKSVVDTSSEIRDEERRNFNIIAAPGYPELMSNLVNLNIDRGLTAFVVGDTPFRLPADATSLTTWGTNANLVTDNGDAGIVTYDEYMAVFYPSGFTTDLSGANAVVPSSHMMLKTIALSDNVSYPWFAPAGTRRGGITNATAVGYVDALSGEFQTIALNEGQRDTLYDLKINPLTFFNGVGLVNYGQKTRARNASALDRINVARLVVYLRSQLNKLARPYIFEPNDKITRDEIKQACESLLLELVGLRALYDFAVVCDESNNTPSRIDRNELYVDIAIEPVKAIEFIYIPLRVKNTGEI
jgi:hypothetical protein